MISNRLLAFLSLTLFAIAGIFWVGSPLFETREPAEDIFRGGEGFSLGLGESTLGDRVSLDEAIAAFKFNLPRELPPGTTLDRVYIGGENREWISLYYNNPSLQSFIKYEIKTQLIISIVQTDVDPVERKLVDLPPVRIEVRDEEGLRVVEVPPRERSGSLVIVCGVNGWGSEPTDTSLGGLQWWSNGVEYIISSLMPVEGLTKIANSMC